MKKNNISERMRNYEKCYDIRLPARMPVLGRLDGHSWHNYTKKCQKPFDFKLIEALDRATLDLCSFVEGTVFAYVQSDEISLLLHTYKTLKTQAWFDNRIQKMTSLAAGRVSSKMSLESINVFDKYKQTEFDAKFWIKSESEVCNYFIERQQDATRNSIQMVAQSLYSPKELYKKDCNQLQEMIFQKGQNWNDLPTYLKRGRCAIKIQQEINGTIRSKWIIDKEIPIFSQNRDYIELLLQTKE